MKMGKQFVADCFVKKFRYSAISLQHVLAMSEDASTVCRATSAGIGIKQLFFYFFSLPEMIRAASHDDQFKYPILDGQGRRGEQKGCFTFNHP
jgi:hypothetical protein